MLLLPDRTVFVRYYRRGSHEELKYVTAITSKHVRSYQSALEQGALKEKDEPWN